MEDTSGENDLSLYAMHDNVSIALSKNESISLFCVKELTPLDMIDLWNGRTDPTGNKIWMGALFFIEVMAKSIPIFPSLDDKNSEKDLTAVDSDLTEGKMRSISLMKLRKELFGRKRVLELGAGTGASGISLIAGAKEANEYLPRFITFTDFDPNVLNLCRKNCAVNLKGNSHNNENYGYAVCSLTWGASLHELDDSVDRNPLLNKKSYDTVIATDVLYDISSLKPLLQTAVTFLNSKGHFVLSHVPRASVDYDSPIADTVTLENIIIKEAVNHGLFLKPLQHESLSNGTGSIFRPVDMINIFKTDETMSCSRSMDLFKEMDEIGASILTFCKS